MIVDTSALCAILFAEPERDVFKSHLSKTDDCYMSAMNFFEAGMVAESFLGPGGRLEMADLIGSYEIDVVAFDASQAEVALDGWQKYGKGRHKAGLNFGDCAAYALAKVTNQPLLFKGDDFAQTDVARVAPSDSYPRG